MHHIDHRMDQDMLLDALWLVLMDHIVPYVITLLILSTLLDKLVSLFCQVCCLYTLPLISVYTYYTVQIFGGYKFCELPQFCFSWKFFCNLVLATIVSYIAEKIFAIE